MSLGAGLAVDVAAEDHKTEKLASCASEFVDAHELGRAELALRRAADVRLSTTQRAEWAC